VALTFNFGIFLFQISAKAPPSGKYVPAVPPVAIVRKVCWANTPETARSRQRETAKAFFIKNLLMSDGDVVYGQTIA
jgi:hypothetical protein